MKHLFTWVFSLLFLSLTAQETGMVTLSGTIINPVNKKVVLQDANGKEVKTFSLNAENKFSGTAEITTGGYSLEHGNESTKIYLIAGDQLDVSLDTKQFDETLKYTGTHAAENNYLAQAYLQNEQMGHVNDYNYYGKLDEKEFLKLTDSVFSVKNKTLNETKNLDNDFVYLQQKTLEFEKAYRLASFPMFHRYVTKNRNYTVSKDFPDPYANIDFEDEKQLNCPSYVYYLGDYFDREIKKTDVEQENYDVAYLLLVDEKISNEKIKDAVLFSVVSSSIADVENVESYYEKYISLTTNQAHKDEITALYNNIKKLAKGQPSPGFTFKNHAGGTLSLADLKGKYVYIDVWATWCQPCLGEIPSLQKLEEKFHGQNIAFVSICTFDKEERWEKMVKEKELGGIQLFAEDGKHSFFTSYLITGIPRFILLDTEGNIISADADRPSNPDLKAQLKSLLAK